MLDVLILTYNDWANTGWKLFKCAQRAGLKVLALKGAFHPFYYPEQIPIHPDIQDSEKVLDRPIYKLHNDSIIKQLIKNSKIIHFTSSTFIDTGVDLSGKNVIVNHSGREYRVFHDDLNAIYNKFVDSTIVQMPDLLGFGANDEHLIYFPVDTDFIKPDYTDHDKLRIGHFPSNATSKGSKMILKILSEFAQDTKKTDKFEFHGCTDADKFWQNEIVMWTDNLRRMANCDVIVDNMAPTAQGNMPYGEWGNTSMEAAALGKIVITNSHRFDVYEKVYGRCELIIANTEDELRSALNMVLSWGKSKVYEKKVHTRKWVEMKHSIKATAERFMINVYGEYLK